jgi:hypothetical protein
MNESHARLVERAVAAYEQGTTTLSELAAETGLPIEEIMRALGEQGQDEALALFLQSSATIAEAHHNSHFLELARRAVEMVKARPPA